jgi:regulator of RNase E activity RraA
VNATPDGEKFATINEKLYTPVVSDALDRLGYTRQAMRHDIRPVHSDFIVVGRARTLLWMATYEPVQPNPYVNEIRAIDSLRPGDVAVHSTDHSGTIAPWGELLSTAARMRGATGTIVDGFVRDVRQIIAMSFPVFARGIMPLDSWGRGYVADVDVKVSCGGVIVAPGDLVFGDYDGIVVVPAAVEDEVLARALEKVTGENRSREELLQGRLLRDVYERYGVL